MKSVALVALLGVVGLALPASALVLGSTADTHVEGKDSGANFGNFSTNQAGTAFFPVLGNAFRLLLQFDATAIPAGNIESARLRLFIDDTTMDPLNLPITVRRLGVTFVEGDGMSGVTWATQPPSTSPAVTGVMNTSAGEWFEIDVTAVVLAALESGATPGVIALLVRATNEAANEDREFSARSKEFGNGSQRPQLVLNFVGDVPLLSMTTSMMLVTILGLVGLASLLADRPD